MKPIAQTFIATEPATGVEAVFLTAVDLYFQAKSSTYGVEVQIRETTNGVPNQNILPFASKILQSGSVNVSADASVSTTFTFDTPVILRSNQQFAIVIVPVGGNPDYTVWTAALGQADATTGAPIYTNNQLGSLFISSNDLNFTAIQNESMKYNLYTAAFSGTSGYAIYKNAPTDFFNVKDVLGTFVYGEQVVVSNNTILNASFTVSSVNTFTVGETVTQSNSSAVYANGIVVSSNSTFLLLANAQGAFTTANTLVGVTSGKIVAAPTNVYQNVATTSACTTITVPSSNSTLVPDFSTGNYVYVGTNTRSAVQVVKVVSADVTNRTLTVTPAISFTDTNAIIGRVKADAALTGVFSSTTRSNTAAIIALDNVTSNASVNFAGSNNQLLIGLSSKASANNVSLIDLMYDSITPQFSYVAPKLTAEDWNFQGISNTKSVDSTYTALNQDTPYEFVDQQRLVMSRSNEFANPIGGSSGTSSLSIKTNLASSNTKMSPYIDRIRNNVVLTRNLITSYSDSYGYLISIANSSGTINTGDTVWQSNSVANTYGKVIGANSTFLIVSNVVSSNQYNMPAFNANGTSTVTDSNNSAVANVVSISLYSEDLGNGPTATRYISKNVVLDQGQDAEDLVSYLGAYRPPGTNLYVYARCLAGADGDALGNKVWSFMPETSSPALLSSLVNRDDLVELTYDLPQSVQIYATGCTGNTTSAVANVVSTGSSSQFTPGQYIYITDVGTNANGFNVRQVVATPNNSSLILSSNLSFISSNCAMGTIPGLNSQAAAFRYASNYNIARYVTTADSVYDTVKTFAIKVVLVSNTSQVVPRITDMRTIAMQA